MRHPCLNPPPPHPGSGAVVGPPSPFSHHSLIHPSTHHLCCLAGKSSTGGSEYDGDSVGGSERGSSLKASGRGKGNRGGDQDSDYEELEVDPFDTAVEQLYEKR